MCEVLLKPVKVKQKYILCHKMPGAERKDIRYTCVKAIEKPIQTRIQNLVKHLRRSVLRKYTLFYKQHLYKQRQAEIGKKSSKC